MVRRRNRSKLALLAYGVNRVKKHPIWSALIAGGLSTGLGFALDATVRRVREGRAATADFPEPQVGRLRFYFKNPVLDAHFSYVLAFQTRAGGDIGESFYAASRVGERDPESWVGEFTELAGRVADLADVALNRGHRISARQTYLRASLYDRMALFALSPVDQPERYRKILQRARSRFRKAAALFDPPVETIEVPFEGKTLPGYFIRADDTGQKRSTILIIGGGESIVEDMCFLAGLGDNERGYNFLTVDLPGQGATPFDGFVVGPAAEVPVEAVVDYALSRPEVDPERLAAWGGSLGGYLVPRAATHEKRLKAIVANSMILDLHAYITQAPEITVLARLEGIPGFPLLSRAVGGRWAAGALTIMDTWKWRWGASSVAEWLEVAVLVQVRRALCRFLSILYIRQMLRRPEQDGPTSWSGLTIFAHGSSKSGSHGFEDRHPARRRLLCRYCLRSWKMPNAVLPRCAWSTLLSQNLNLDHDEVPSRRYPPW